MTLSATPKRLRPQRPKIWGAATINMSLRRSWPKPAPSGNGARTPLVYAERPRLAAPEQYGWAS
jgi:hypothetical protein